MEQPLCLYAVCGLQKRYSRRIGGTKRRTLTGAELSNYEHVPSEPDKWGMMSKKREMREIARHTHAAGRAMEDIAGTADPRLVRKPLSASSGYGQREMGGMTSQTGGGIHELENMVGFDLRKGASAENTNE